MMRLRLQIRLVRFDSGPRLQNFGSACMRGRKWRYNLRLADLLWRRRRVQRANAGIAQLVERNLAKVEVESSRLFSRSIFAREASASLFSWWCRALHACTDRVTLLRRCALGIRRPDGEIGRHCGLKIRRFPEKGRAGSTPARGTTKSLFNVFLEIALECNRDEWMLQVRRMGSCPCQQLGRPIARFHSNPAGKCLAGRSAALRRLPIAELLAAHRAWQPIPARYLCDSKKTLNRL